MDLLPLRVAVVFSPRYLPGQNAAAARKLDELQGLLMFPSPAGRLMELAVAGQIKEPGVQCAARHRARCTTAPWAWKSAAQAALLCLLLTQCSKPPHAPHLSPIELR